MIIRAIKINAMSFLYCVWAFNKNYCRIKSKLSTIDSDSERNPDKYQTYTFNYLIKTVLEHCPDDHAPRIRAICDWRLKSSENFLMAMLMNRQDVIACEYANYYLRDAKKKLFRFALRNQNEIFLKYALNNSIFGESLFKQEKIKKELMDMLKLKTKTEFVLNVCLFADMSMCLKQSELEEFI
jgi:hypothetical protein